MATVVEPTLAPVTARESSDRSFGLVFAVAFALLGGSPLLHGAAPRWWALAVAAAFVFVALIQPHRLRPLNHAWQMLGRALHRVMSPLIMSVIFFLCVTPIAAVMRWRGK